MGNELNRYYIKIRTILQINPKTIHEEFWDPVLHHIQQLQDGQKRFRERRKDVNDHSRSVSPLSEFLQIKIFNCFDKLSAMIHIQLIMKL